MKKIGKFINIAVLLVIGATFSTQINAGIDYLVDVDYVALGNTISTIVGKIVDFAVLVYDWVVGLFADAPVMEAVADGSGTASSTIN